MIRDCAERILLMQGWQRHGLAFAAGLVAALALAPLDFLPALLLAIPLLIWLIDGAAFEQSRWRHARSAAVTGWFFGFGYLVAGLWWLGVAFVTGGEGFIWLMPLGVVGLPMALALFFALGAALSALLWSDGAMRVAALAFGFGVSEWLRGWVFTGFPWNGFGQMFANHLILAQSASLIGSEGLGLAAVLIAGSFAMLGTGETRGARWTAPTLGIILFASLAGFGAARLMLTGGMAFNATTMPVVPDVTLRLMQPNVPQSEKNAGGSGAQIFSRYLELSNRAVGPRSTGLADVTHLFWPEAPLPFILDREPQALQALTQLLGSRTKLITGAVRAEERATPDAMGRRARYFNAIQVYEGDGLQATYDKLHLVPFGEYLPFESFLRALGLRQFVETVGGFSPGLSRKPLPVAGLPPVTPIVCYEAIFPHEIAPAQGGIGIFVNVTNDAWFGATSGPYQHLAQARLRSIEFGMPMIRSANSGISVVFDGYGRIVDMIPLEVAGILDAPLPTGLESTLYARTIQFSYGSVMICLLAFCLLVLRRTGTRGKRERLHVSNR